MTAVARQERDGRHRANRHFVDAMAGDEETGPVAVALDADDRSSLHVESLSCKG
jgi:hypothetical protein